MTTAFSLADTLAKDAGGAKFSMLTDVSTSQLDFALMAGIGSRTTGSKIAAALQVATYTGASRIDTPVLGIALVGHYTSAVCAMGLGQAMPIRASASGALFTTGLSTTACVSSGSTETLRAVSGILYSGVVAFAGAVAGACVVLLDSGTSRGVFITDAANQCYPFNYGPQGVAFGTSIRYERRNTTGVVHVSLNLDA